MIRRLDLPGAACTAPDTGDSRMSAPAALRNRDAIVSELQQVAPAWGRALEIASGTGEHVIRFAAAMPGLQWQPSDPDPARRRSIAAWSAAHPSPNLLPPLDLDAARAGWSARTGAFDLIVLINLLHLISDDEAGTVIAEIASATTPGGIVALYGPFLRDGHPTSDGDAGFHAALRAQDPAIGYKDVADVIAQAADRGLDHTQTRAMPANNLLLLFCRPVTG
ncbi:MAG: DUF938 domain-containing protein [Roseicyclus sp.]